MAKQQFLMVDLAKPFIGLVGLEEVKASLKEGRCPVVLDFDATWAGFRRALPDPQKTFDIDELAACAGISRTAANMWIDMGILPPASVKPAAGSGNRRLWSYEDAFVAGLLGCLSRQRVPRSGLREVAQAWAARNTGDIETVKTSREVVTA